MQALALALFLFTGTKDTTQDDTWPQWRGPRGDSVASAKLPTTWSKTENVAWKTPITGWGTSTPVIWKDAIFLTTQEKDSLLVLRIDRATGKVVWQHELNKGTPRRKGDLGNLRFHDEHNMASPSPITDGKHVWFHFGTGDFACFTFDGDKVWSTNLPEKYGFYSIWWGHANSPVIIGDLIFSVCMQDPKGGGKSYVVAHDKLTGKEKWLVDRTTGAKDEPADSYTTPLVYQNKGRTELIVFGGNVLDAYEPATGRKLWHCTVFKGNRVITGPTLSGDTVYAVQGMKGPLFAIKAGGDNDVNDTHVRWKYAGTTPDAASPVVANGLVFLATNPGVAVCIDAETGKEVWKQRLGDGFRATPLVVGDKIYLFTKEGAGIVIDASREFKVLAKNELGEEIMASPAAVGGDLFIRTKAHLYRVHDAKDAK